MLCVSYVRAPLRHDGAMSLAFLPTNSYQVANRAEPAVRRTEPIQWTPSTSSFYDTRFATPPTPIEPHQLGAAQLQQLWNPLTPSFRSLETLYRQVQAEEQLAEAQTRHHAAVLLVDTVERDKASAELRRTLARLTKLEKHLHEMELKVTGLAGLQTPTSAYLPSPPEQIQGCSFARPLCPMAFLVTIGVDLMQDRW